MIAETDRNNESLTPEESELLAAFRANNFDRVGEVVSDRRAAEEKERERNQEKHALDIVAVKLVKALDEVIDDLAYELATARGNRSHWAQEEAANDLLRELSQFLIQGQLDKYDEADFPIAKRHQLSDELFSFEWFDVSVLVDGTLVSVKE